jgi:hypothetical protein
MSDPKPVPPPPAAPLPAALRARVLAEVPRRAAKLPKPLGVTAIVGAGAAWVALFASLHGRRANWGDLPPAASWMALGQLALVAALSTLAALARGALMFGPPARRVAAALSASAVVAAAVALAAPNTTPTPRDSFWAETLACEAGIVAVALPLLVLLAFRHRGRVLASPALAGALAGVVAATWGHALLHWGCPWTDAAHVLVGHAAPALPLALGGAAFASWLNRRRPPPV